MKKLVSIIIISLISFLTFYILTLYSKKDIETHLDLKNPNDSIISSTLDTIKVPEVAIYDIDTLQPTMKTGNDKALEDNMLQDIKNAQVYLRDSIKDKDILIFYKTRLENHYKIKGLTKETNKLLLSTIEKIKKEL